MAIETAADAPGPVIPILDEKLEDFRTEATEFLAGNPDPAKFTGFRLKQGTYGQRQADVHMLRVKLPMGGVTADPLDAFAEVAERFAPLNKGHITTRPNIQLHHILLDLVPDALGLLASVGLSTREACGNIVRNVTADPRAGVRDDELFDVTPYAGAFVRYWVRNPITQLLPRKFKVFFTGSPHDAAIAGMHDLALIAAVRYDGGREVRGFPMLVGGGLSTAAKHAIVLSDFVSLDEYLRCSEAVLRIFNEADELRKNIVKARIKFLVHRVGPDRFREMVDEELQNGWAREPVPPDDLLFLDDEAAAPAPPNGDRAAFDRFVARSARPQRQRGYSTVEVKVPQGASLPRCSAGWPRSCAPLAAPGRAQRTFRTSYCAGSRMGTSTASGRSSLNWALETLTPVRSPTSSAAPAPTAASSASPRPWGSTAPCRPNSNRWR